MSPRMPRVTAEELLQELRRDGWQEVRHRRHVALTHSTKPGLIAVPMHSGKTLKVGTLAKIVKDAGLTPDDLRRLL